MSDAKIQAAAQVRSIVSLMRACDESNWERMEELSEQKTPRYVAGWNMPGYMPDAEPAEFDNVEDAVSYLTEEMEREACILTQDADYEETSSGEQKIRELAADIMEAVNTLRNDPAEFGGTFGRLHFWVTRDGEMGLDAEEQEELSALESDLGEYESAEDAQERVFEDPLSVEVRSGWAAPGSDLEAEEFRIVLCTGGPHVELQGDFDSRGVSRVRVIFKDWGEGGEYYPDENERAALEEYCARLLCI